MAVTYRLSGHFAGRICEECLAHFADVKVMVYRSVESECPDEPRVAKDFQQLSAQDVENMRNRLLTEGRTNSVGMAQLVIDPAKTPYQGECIEVVVVFERLVGSDKQLESPEYFRVARYRPRWDETAIGQTSSAEFIVPSRYWCAYLQKHKVWAICGRVTLCQKPNSPIGGVTVQAFDVDWIEDDALGSAVTDASGWFLIYYDRTKFTHTPLSPFLNFEWIGGPDVYFKIEGVDTAGNPLVLLSEPRSRGRQPDRENVGHCFCVALCVETFIQDPTQVPMWTHIGAYQIPDAVNLHDFRTEGYTSHAKGNLAFFSNLEFIGQTGKATATKQRRYRFLYAKWSGATMPTPTNPVTKEMIAATQVGVIIKSLSPLELEPVWVNNPVAARNHEPDPVTGWIEVENDPNFTPVSNKLITLISTKLAPDAVYGNPSPNPSAGTVAPLDTAREIHKYALRYQVEENTGAGWVSVHDQTMEALVMNNANILLWLELDEFLAPSADLCRPITHTVTAKYTVDHPHLDWYQITIERQGTPMATPVGPIGHAGSLTFRGGNGSAATNVSDATVWKPCSYLVMLSAHRRVTNGYSQPSIEWVYRTFCKS
jgi:hypothetical protein